MASIVGVSSFYPLPSLELARRASPSVVSASSLTPSEKLPLGGFRALRSSRDPRANPLFIPSAIATPNSVLSEEAFKRLGDFSKGTLDGEEDEYGPDMDGSEGEDSVREDELAIANLGLPQKLVDTLEKRGITHLFPIQRAVLLPALEGRDLIARAKTGTGKTLAFGIPIIKRLTIDDEGRNFLRRSGRLPRVLVLAPTRELAKQVEKEIQESAPHLNTVCVYGGVSYNVQQNALSRGVDVVVGTPGRIIDLINSNSLRLSEVQFLVLDEADQMLAVGFEEDVEVILEKLPSERQSMLFSATMPGWVKKLARKYLNNPLTIDLVGDQEEKLAEGIKLYAIPTTATSKRTILSDLITVYAKGGKTIVFTQTKRDADEVSMALTNSIASEALHGDISQHQRERTLNGFRQGKFTVLVATDVAARGLDIPNVDLIIHYELPNDPETFVHRSGRTGRAGKEGTAILMFTSNQRRTVKSLERDVGCSFEFITPPQIEEVLASSAEQVVATLSGVHPESIAFFLPAAHRLIEEKGTDALAAALAHLSGFSQPPSSRSLISHEQGWVTLQLTREPGYSRGYLSPRSVTGFLSDVYPAAADNVGKIYLLADEKVQGAVFDLPEEIARELLNKQTPPGNTISKITKLPALQDDGPPSDFYGKFSSRERGFRGGARRKIASSVFSLFSLLSFLSAMNTTTRGSLNLTSLNHISLVCKSVENSVDFYQNVLGFIPVRRPGSFDFDGAWLFSYGIGVHLLQSENPDAMSKKTEINPKDNHISFQCESMKAVERKLKEMGIEYIERTVEEGGIYVDQMFFHDPDGFMIEICNCDNLPVIPLVGEAVRVCGRSGCKQQQQQQQPQPMQCHATPAVHVKEEYPLCM